MDLCQNSDIPYRYQKKDATRIALSIARRPGGDVYSCDLCLRELSVFSFSVYGENRPEELRCALISNNMYLLRAW